MHGNPTEPHDGSHYPLNAVAVEPTGYSDRSTLSGGLLDGRYEILRRIGEGGMSYVYQGRDRESGMVLALKVLSPLVMQEPVALARLRREAGLAMRLDHPNICSILRVGELPNGLLYLVMPYLAGELLADRQEREGPLSLDTGITFMVQICAGLYHAHELSIVHRDLKPENVMIVPDDEKTEQAVILDFGLAKSVDANVPSINVTATGKIPGTPEFMSPEQVRGDPVDARSDIYALGVLGTEMFSGRLPFQGRTTQQIMISRLESRPQPVRQLNPNLPVQLETTLLKALEPDPNDRFQTTRELAGALIDTIGGVAADRLEGLFR